MNKKGLKRVVALWTLIGVFLTIIWALACIGDWVRGKYGPEVQGWIMLSLMFVFFSVVFYYTEDGKKEEG